LESFPSLDELDVGEASVDDLSTLGAFPSLDELDVDEGFSDFSAADSFTEITEDPSSFEAQSNDLIEQLNQLAFDRDTLQDQLEILNQEHNGLQADYETILAEQAQTRSEYDRLQQEYASMETALQTQQEQAMIPGELETLQNNLNAESTLRHSLEVSLADKEDEIARLKEDLDVLYSQYNYLETQLSELETTRQVVAESQAMIEKLEEQIAHLNENAATTPMVAIMEDDSGLPTTGFVNELRLFMTRMRERISRLDQAGRSQPQMVQQLVNEIGTTITILNDISQITHVSPQQVSTQNLDNILSNVYASVFDKAQAKNIELTRTSLLGVEILGDHNLLQRAFYDVLSSVIDFAMPNSAVTMVSNIDTEQVILSITFQTYAETAAQIPTYLKHFDQGIPHSRHLALARTAFHHQGGRLVARSHYDSVDLLITLNVKQ